MSLQPRLDRIRTSFEHRATPETLAIMHEATDALRGSGILDRVVGEGQRAPGITLADSGGREFDLGDTRSRGPVVLTWYRGDW